MLRCPHIYKGEFLETIICLYGLTLLCWLVTQRNVYFFSSQVAIPSIRW